MARCHRTVTDAMPSVDAIAATDRPSSSCITTTARRRGGNASSARHTTTLANRAASCAFPGSTDGLQFRIVSLADGRLAPLVAPEIDESSDELGFFARCAGRNGRRGPRSSDERVLHQIERIVGTGRESPGQAIQAQVVRVEQVRQSVSLVVRRGERDVGSGRHAVHISSRRVAPGNCWPSRHPVLGSLRDLRTSRTSWIDIARLAVAFGVYTS